MSEPSLNSIYYLHMDKSDVLLRLSDLGTNLSGFMCGLFSIHGTIKVDITKVDISSKRCFLCSDICDKDSILPNYISLPVLREIILIDRALNGNIVIDHDFSQILWLDTAHTVIRDIRLFLSDEEGKAFPVEECFLKCTLLSFKKRY